MSETLSLDRPGSHRTTPGLPLSSLADAVSLPLRRAVVTSGGIPGAGSPPRPGARRVLGTNPGRAGAPDPVNARAEHPVEAFRAGPGEQLAAIHGGDPWIAVCGGAASSSFGIVFFAAVAALSPRPPQRGQPVLQRYFPPQIRAFWPWPHHYRRSRL